VHNFLTTILPTQGVYCSFAAKDGQVRQTFCDSIDELADVNEAHDAKGFDAYQALATFKTRADGRTQGNVAFLRTIFLEIDCGAGKPYADQAAAMLALRAFIDKHKLPTPTIVGSGGGVHVYWVLDRDVTVDEWLPVAKSLKTLCLSGELDIDPVVSTDSARVLRMPGTHNYKQDVSRLVSIMHTGKPIRLEDFAALLPAAPMMVDFSSVKGGFDSTTSDLAGLDYPDSSFLKIAQRSIKGTGCAQIAFILNNAATLEEPLWRAGLSIATVCVDREKSIHRMSKPHSGYSYEATEKKAAETKGPYTCEWFKQNSPTGCEGCAHKITSPISLGRVVVESEVVDDAYVVEALIDPDLDPTAVAVLVTIPKYVFPYFRGLAGGVYLKTKDKAGDPVDLEVYHRDLYLTTRFYDLDKEGEGDGEMVGINLHLEHDGVRRFHSPITALFSPEKLRDTLVKHGAIAYGNQIPLIMNYFGSTIKQLQSQYAANRTRSQMGWTDDMQGFVIGELEYSASGPRLAPPGSGTRQFASLFHPKGTLENWSKVANFYNRPGMEAQALALFFGFGSPLLKFIGGNTVKGAMVNLMSNASGTGKTTAQMVINSLFGNPKDLLMDKNDTQASKYHRLGMMNSVASTVDEITNMLDLELSDWVYGTTAGRGRHRMEAQSNKLRANGSTWCNITVTSSNSSIIDKLSQLKSTSDGELRRVLEIFVPPITGVSKEESDEIFNLLNDNYGHAGPIFINEIFKDKEAVIAALKKMQATLDADLNLSQSDRFHSCILACAFVGAMIARRLGLHDIDVDRIYKYALNLISNSRIYTASAVGDPLTIAQETLTSYINENINGILVINSIGKGGIPSAPIRDIRGNQLKIRYEPDTQNLFVVSADFKRYCQSKQVDVQRSLALFVKAGLIRHEGGEKSKRIGSGAVSGVPSLPTRCFCFDGRAIGLDVTQFAPDVKP